MHRGLSLQTKVFFLSACKIVDLAGVRNDSGEVCCFKTWFLSI